MRQSRVAGGSCSPSSPACSTAAEAAFKAPFASSWGVALGPASSQLAARRMGLPSKGPSASGRARWTFGGSGPEAT
eukprot:scaffold128092_cov25-Prasinocladus_malaysianus.AAC.1